jgi:hypothetical protein
MFADRILAFEERIARGHPRCFIRSAVTGSILAARRAGG